MDCKRVIESLKASRSKLRDALIEAENKALELERQYDNTEERYNELTHKLREHDFSRTDLGRFAKFRKVLKTRNWMTPRVIEFYVSEDSRYVCEFSYGDLNGIKAYGVTIVDTKKMESTDMCRGFSDEADASRYIMSLGMNWRVIQGWTEYLKSCC